jgi:hypothetical protein
MGPINLCGGPPFEELSGGNWIILQRDPLLNRVVLGGLGVDLGHRPFLVLLFPSLSGELGLWWSLRGASLALR